MSIKFNMIKDLGGYNGFGIQPTTDIFNGSLAANVAQSITVPSNHPNWIAIFTYAPGATIWVNFTTTATVPTGTVGASSNTLNPSARLVTKGQTLSLITADITNPWVNVELQVIAPYSD